MNRNKLTDDLITLANLIETNRNEELLLDYAYDCYQQIEVLINEIAGD